MQAVPTVRTVARAAAIGIAPRPAQATREDRTRALTIAAVIPVRHLTCGSPLPNRARTLGAERPAMAAATALTAVEGLTPPRVPAVVATLAAEAVIPVEAGTTNEALTPKGVGFSS